MATTSMRRCRDRSGFLVIWALLLCPFSSAGEADQPSGGRLFEKEIEVIEKLRGVEFPSGMTHREIRRADLKKFLRNAFARDLSLSEQDYFDSLRALHLLDREPEDPLETLLDLYVSQVLAFYDPVDDIFYSIDETPAGSKVVMTEAFERAVTIHELVHALQDHSFGAGETISAVVDDWDRSLAYHALVEGEATLVMLAVLIDGLGGSLDQALADDQIVAALGEAATMKLDEEGAPAYFIESLKFPYVEGLAYAIRLYREGGWDALERAHRAPPLSAAEIYDDQALEHIVPIGFQESLMETTLGEFHWRFLLGDQAASEWVADRVAIIRGDEGLNILAVTKWSSAGAAAGFADAYGAFLRMEGRKPLVHVDDQSVTVVYGSDQELCEDLMKHALSRHAAEEGIEHQ
ncbi:MAG: hypothetical protein KY432_00985 [Acidobacteria bacterium]|nr:hypothetical protein [Acidobacteriota bacterium]